MSTSSLYAAWSKRIGPTVGALRDVSERRRLTEPTG
jgi:hypothetical protein